MASNGGADSCVLPRRRRLRRPGLTEPRVRPWEEVLTTSSDSRRSRYSERAAVMVAGSLPAMTRSGKSPPEWPEPRGVGSRLGPFPGGKAHSRSPLITTGLRTGKLRAAAGR